MTAPPTQVDVLIVGAGPAGLMASLCLTTYGFRVLHIDDRPHPTTSGRADGIQPRTIEVLRNIGSVSKEDEPGEFESGKAPFAGGGLAKEMIKKGVRVYEVSFWDPTPTSQLARTSRSPSCPDFIDVEDNYTLLLHQGRIERAYFEEIEKRRHRLPNNSLTHAPEGGCFRPYRILHTSSSSHSTDTTHPCLTTIQHIPSSHTYTISSKYVIGCDGAKSVVRKCIAGGENGDGEWKGKIKLEGEGTEIVWGVMDVRVETDFPDLKCKNLIHSAHEGSIMTIPREANLCRFYVQLQEGEHGKHVERSKATQEICMNRAKKIFQPFKLEFGYVDWFSVYQIGQRIASKYTLDHRIFLAGDSVHSHSPKAGQGMNLSCLDTFDLCWKINMVEKGLGSREVLLPLYEHERRGVAQELLKFDREYSRLFSGQNPSQDLASTANIANPSSTTKEGRLKATKDQPDVDAQKFIEIFKRNAAFTSGCGATYFANPLNALPDSEVVNKGKSLSWGKAFNPEGCQLIPGRRLLPGKLTRAIDANIVRLQQEVKMNGAFRIHFFLGDLWNDVKTRKKVESIGNWLKSGECFVNRYRGKRGKIGASIVDGLGSGRNWTEVQDIVKSSPSQASSSPSTSFNPNPFFTFLSIISSPHRSSFEISDLPLPLRFYRDQIYGDDRPDRRVPSSIILDGSINQHPKGTVHKKYGIDEKEGAIVIVRPDGFVGAVIGLGGEEEEWRTATEEYFKGFLVERQEEAKL